MIERTGRRVGAGFQWAAAAMFLQLPVAPLHADEAADELTFAGALIELGFHDFARKITDQTLERWPDRADDAKRLRAELLMAERKFADAEEIVRTIPPTSNEGKAIRLALANHYYTANEIDKARGLYEDFFKQYPKPPTDPDLLRFYTEAAFVLSQMLENAEQYEEAARKLARVLETDMDGERRRGLLAKQASLYLMAAEAGGKNQAALIETARNLAEEMQYGGPFWVARSMVLLADADRVAGKPDVALQRLEDQLSLIRQIDGSLKEAGVRDHSPKAAYHYTRGRIFEVDALKAADRAQGKDEATRAAARKGLAPPLNEYARILKYYGGSDFGAPATLRMRALEDQIIELGGAVKRLTRIESGRPRNADELFRQGDLYYSKGEDDAAIEEYIRVLNQFPETDASFRVLSNLGRAYARSGDPLMAKAVTAYVGERFAGREEAGKSCLILAGFFRKNALPELADFAYQIFVDNFPRHEKAPLVLYTLAQSKKASAPEKADALYNRIVKNYPKSEYHLRSLQSLGWDLHSRKRYAEAAPYFQQYAESAPEGHGRANAMMLAADSLLRSQAHAEAFKQFRSLISALDPDLTKNPYYADETERPKLETLFEQASFQQAYCLSQMDGDPDRVAAFRAAAIQSYDQFAEHFPRSELVPKALAGKGAVLLQLDRLDEATETFERLAAEYPDSPEGKNSLYTLVTAAVKVGKLEVAQQAVENMAANPGNYQDEMFARVGQLMLEHGLYDQAIDAYRILGETTQNPDLKERALFGLGSSFHAQNHCEKAIEKLSGLIALNDRTAYLFEAEMMLAQALRACGRHDEAIDALTDIFTVDSDPVRRSQANIELALIQEAQGRKKDSYASYLRLGLNPRPTRSPELEPMIKESIYRSVKLGMELQDYETVVMMADKFEDVWGVNDAWSMEIRTLRGEAAIEQSKLGGTPAGTP